MLQYFDELKDVLNYYDIQDNDCVIVGSCCITMIGGRKNNDIEFMISQNAMKKMPLRFRVMLLFFDHVDISENVDLFSNRYLVINIKDKDLASNKKLICKYNGLSIARPEIEVAYKQKRMWKKDYSDLLSIRNELKSKINWQFVEDLNNETTQLSNRIFIFFRKKCWSYRERILNLFNTPGGGYCVGNNYYYLYATLLLIEGKAVA